MSQSRYFLSDIYLVEEPIMFKFVDVETGEHFKKQLTDFAEDQLFIHRLNEKDRKTINKILELENLQSN